MFTKSEATTQLRDAAAVMADIDQTSATQSLADYLDSTFDYFGHRMAITERVFLGELAEAFRAGYDQATLEPSRSREIGTAIRIADLSV